MRVARIIRAALALLLIGIFGWLPTAHAQDDARFFPATGHSLTSDYGFLQFWNSRGGERLLGLPISEVFERDGRAMQYFEHTRLEQIIEANGRRKVVTGPVGREYAEALGRQFSEPQQSAGPGEMLFRETGHVLREPFLSFWRQSAGLELFGPPISPVLWEVTEGGQRQVQYFDRGRLERDPAAAGTPNEVRVSQLGPALARLQQVDLGAIANPGYSEAGRAAAIAPDNGPLVPPTPTPLPTPLPTAVPKPRPTAAPAPRANRPLTSPAQRIPTGGAKAVIVNLSHQWLYAYEGGELVFSAPVTTGRRGMETPAGTFRIYAKLPVQTMRGVDKDGPWVVPNVPHVMYIYGGVALHGTYWHNLFGSGTRVSHGCINLPLRSAAWLYNWAPAGTVVTVTY
jgi:lipoprotein-anchoring transpeptidase ErfK/SrfK